MNKDDQVTINQHYVPQFYLNNFAYLNKKGKPCIDVLDMDLNKILRNQRIQNIASENYFYDIDMEKYLKDASKFRKIIVSLLLKVVHGIKFKLSSYKKLNVAEKIFSDIESKSSPIFIKLIDKAEKYTPWEIENCYLINDDEKKNLAEYLAIQFQRTPKVRHTIFETNTYVKAELFRELYYRETGEIIELSDLIEEKNSEDIKQQHLDYIFNGHTSDVAQIFMKHDWVFYKNNTDIDFITSDTPISGRATRDESLMSYGGISSPGVMLLFPVTRKLLLVMYEKELNKEHLNKKLMICDEPEVIEAFNIVIFLNCHRFLYGQVKEFKQFDKYIKFHKKSIDIKTILVNSTIPKNIK